MTLAPRVEVYTKLACRAIHHSETEIPAHVPFAPTAAHATPSDPIHTVRVILPDISSSALDECSADPKVQARAARIQACPCPLPSLTVHPLM